MQIIGHELIKFEKLNRINSFNDTLEFDNLLFDFNKKIIKKAKEENKEFSIIAKDKKEIILANAVGAKFIVIDKNNKELLKEAVDLAEYYLFDSKIALVIDAQNELLDAINFRVDTAIFYDAIISRV